MRVYSILLSLFLVLQTLGSFAKDAPLTFQKQTLKVGSVSLTAEIADTPAKSSQGLMFRKSLKDGSGMLFIFPDNETRTFWMKNTFVPLSIGFFDEAKTLIDMQDMTPVKSEMQLDVPTYRSKGPAKYALEVPQGWFQKHKIKLGDKLTGL